MQNMQRKNMLKALFSLVFGTIICIHSCKRANGNNRMTGMTHFYHLCHSQLKGFKKRKECMILIVHELDIGGLDANHKGFHFGFLCELRVGLLRGRNLTRNFVV